MSNEDKDNPHSDPMPLIMDEEASEEKIKELEERFSNLARTIREDARQLSEYLIAEEKAINDICSFLRRILSELDLSVVIPEKTLPNMEKSRKIILNSECHLITVLEDGTVESRSLSNCPPETILAVLWALLPILKDEVNAYLRRVSMRFNLLETLKEELKDIQRPFIHEEEESERFREEKVKEIFIPQ